MQQEETRQICDSLGAVFETALTIDTTFLVADATEGDKYRVRVGLPPRLMELSFVVYAGSRREWDTGLAL